MSRILGVHTAPRQHWVGDGFPVRSLFSYDGLGRELSPFLMLDHAAPYQFGPGKRPRGVGSHPHRGFETVTFVYQGEVEHRDSTGGGGVIGPGDVQWMTAAGGIIHDEFHSKRFTETGGTLEFAQLWVNLPAKDKMAKPGYQSITSGQIPQVALPDGAGHVRVIAGSYDGSPGPANTFTPIDVRDITLTAGHTARFDSIAGHTLAVVVMRGTVLVNGESIAREGQLVQFDRAGGEVSFEANGDVTLLWLSGEPIDEPIVAYGPFVMNSQDEIRQAITDFNSGKFGRLPA